MEYLIIAIEGAIATVVAHLMVSKLFPSYSLPNSITLANSRERIALALLVGLMSVVWTILHVVVRTIRD